MTVGVSLLVAGLLFSGSVLVGGDEIRLHAQLVAPLIASGIGGQADFRSRPGKNRTKLSVEAEGLTPDDQFDVVVSGVVVGTMVINILELATSTLKLVMTLQLSSRQDSQHWMVASWYR